VTDSTSTGTATTPLDHQLSAAEEEFDARRSGHSFNASSFTARIVTSSLSRGTAVIGALKGRLRGGTNEVVMRMMLTVDDPSRAVELLRQELAAERNVGGQHEEGIL
jgi:Citrate synthase, C-terminal domain